MSEPLILRDGRRLAYSLAGPPDGFPVLYMHGAIGTALAPEPVLGRLGVRYVGVSRPGFAGSEPAPGRTILGFATDVEQLADALRLARFAVVGVSAGGPYALACARALGERVSAVAAVSSLSPLCAPHAVPEMPAHIRLALRALAARPAAAARLGEGAVALVRRHPGLLVRAMTAGAPACDRSRLAGDEARAAAAARFLAAAGGGVRGMVEDYVISTRPWGFALADVDVDVHVFHGTRDALVPVDHALALASSLPRCRAWLDPDEGHFLFRRRLETVLGVLVPQLRLEPALKRGG
jgi:pimeloyl-ACP methyl ester carboxylesterase